MRKSINRWSLVRMAALTLVGAAIVAACTRDDGSPTGLSTVDRRANLVYHYAYPIADVLAGSMEPLSNKYATLDETSPNDETDYVWRNHWGTTPVIDSSVVRLNTLGYTPDPVAGNCYVFVRMKFTGNYDPNSPQNTLFRYTLADGAGAGTIVNRYLSPSLSYATDSVAFSPSSSYNWNTGFTLKFWVQEKAKTASDMVSVHVTWAAFKCPAAF